MRLARAVSLGGKLKYVLYSRVDVWDFARYSRSLRLLPMCPRREFSLGMSYSTMSHGPAVRPRGLFDPASAVHDGFTSLGGEIEASLYALASYRRPTVARRWASISLEMAYCFQMHHDPFLCALVLVML